MDAKQTIGYAAESGGMITANHYGYADAPNIAHPKALKNKYAKSLKCSLDTRS
jgi:hypothetical protein